MFYQQPLAGSAKAIGSLKLLQCYANGDPQPVYQWLKDDQPMAPINSTETTKKIQNIQRSDAGEYQCIAINPHGAILSDKVFVHVACKY